MKRFKDFLKKFDQTILNSKNQKQNQQQEFDFKGQKIENKTRGQGPQMTEEQFYQSTRFEKELEMQPRKIRLKNWGYLALFLGWYAGIMFFIAYRLKSDDLQQMEKEAEQRINLQKDVKRLNSIYSK